MEQLPNFINILFVLTTMLTLWLFVKATRFNKTVAVVLTVWITLQALIASTGFYAHTDALPPRLLLALLPPIITIIVLLATINGRAFVDNINMKTLTLLHIIRIPVELVLLLLFLHKVIPGIMTFEGRNFDIISGITAPLIYYAGFIKKKAPAVFLLGWNIICLLLLINIVTIAILSAPFPFQRFGFDQPNIAILYPPYIWLPSCIVPIVFFAHLVAIRRILMGKMPVPA